MFITRFIKNKLYKNNNRTLLKKDGREVLNKIIENINFFIEAFGKSKSYNKKIDSNNISDINSLIFLLIRIQEKVEVPIYQNKRSNKLSLNKNDENDILTLNNQNLQKSISKTFYNQLNEQKP